MSSVDEIIGRISLYCIIIGCDYDIVFCFSIIYSFMNIAYGFVNNRSHKYHSQVGNNKGCFFSE